MNTYTNATYKYEFKVPTPHAIDVEIDGVMSLVPINLDNRHYKKMVALIESGELVVQDNGAVMSEDDL